MHELAPQPVRTSAPSAAAAASVRPSSVEREGRGALAYLGTSLWANGQASTVSSLRDTERRGSRGKDEGNLIERGANISQFIIRFSSPLIVTDGIEIRWDRAVSQSGPWVFADQTVSRARRRAAGSRPGGRRGRGSHMCSRYGLWRGAGADGHARVRRCANRSRKITQLRNETTAN